MREKLKSINTDALKYGASQFKANIPSLQGVILTPETTNPINVVLEATKENAETIVPQILSANIPQNTEEFSDGVTPMVRIFLALPEEPNFFYQARIRVGLAKRIYVYTTGALPEGYFLDRFGNRYIEEIYFVNDIKTSLNMFGTESFRLPCKLVFCKNTEVGGETININNTDSAVFTFIFNGEVKSEANAITVPHNINLFIAPQEDIESIAARSIVANVMNMFYKGEWNATTRRWIEGNIYFLNGEPLDPLTQRLNLNQNSELDSLITY